MIFSVGNVFSLLSMGLPIDYTLILGLPLSAGSNILQTLFFKRYVKPVIQKRPIRGLYGMLVILFETKVEIILMLSLCFNHFKMKKKIFFY